MRTPIPLLALLISTFARFADAQTVTPTLYGLGTDVNQDAIVDGFSTATSGGFRMYLQYTPTSHIVQRSLLLFDLSGITHVDSAIFDFVGVIGASNPGSYSYETFLYADDGTMTLADFNASGTQIDFQPGSFGFAQSINVTSEVNALLAGGASFVDIRHQYLFPVGGNPNNQSVFLEYGSSNFDAQSRPKLTLTGAVPEPASGALLLCGAVFAAQRRRRLPAAP